MKTIQEFERRLEQHVVSMEGERAQQFAGLEFSEERMEEAARQIQALSQQALNEIPPEQFPRSLLFTTITSARQSDYTRMENEIYRCRNEKVAVQVNGERVSLDNWRRFNRIHLQEPGKRREAFDGLMEKAKALTPLLEERFNLSRKLFAEHGLSPLSTYLEEEQVSLARLVELVEGLALQAKPFFLEQGSRYGQEILGKPIEYFDDMYVFRGAIFQPLDSHFDIDLSGRLMPVFERMGFNLHAIRVDGSTRQGKHASPVCFAVQVPTDVRVLFQPTSPVADTMSFLHEMGHALHFANIDEKQSFSHRYLVPNGIAEIFSTLFEALATEPVFLCEELGIPEKIARDLVARNRFMLLYFLVFYGVNSMLKVRFWQDHLTMDRADALYADLAQQFMGLPLPGIYWQTHHVASMYDMYTPSYLLAQIRMEELRKKLEQQYGNRWWKDLQVSDTLRKYYIAPGAAIRLEDFSQLDEGPFWQTIVPG
jgi:hypothetical protein